MNRSGMRQACLPVTSSVPSGKEGSDMTTQAKQACSKEQRLAVEYVILRSGRGFTDGLCSGYLTYFHEIARSH